MGPDNKAPQVWSDNGANAPEVDQSILAPEVDCGSAPDLLRTSEPPEAVVTADSDDKEVQLTGRNSQMGEKKAKKIRYTVSGLLLLLITGLGVGLGTGVGLRNAHQGPALPISASPSATPSPSPYFQHAILDDSAFAAVTLLDGSRHIIFQDANSTLRRAVSDSNGDHWDTTLTDFVGITGDVPLPAARPLTPLSACLRFSDGEDGSGNTIYLFYVSLNDSIALATYNPSGGWSNGTYGWSNGAIGGDFLDFSQLSPFTLSKHSRSLSVAIASEEKASVPNLGIFLMFHDSNEFPVFLYGTKRVVSNDTAHGESYAITFVNVTEKLTSALHSKPTATTFNISTLANATFSNIVSGGNPEDFYIAISLSRGDVMPQPPFEIMVIRIESHLNATFAPDFVFQIGVIGPNYNPLLQPFTFVLMNANRTWSIDSTSNQTSNVMPSIYHVQNDSLVGDGLSGNINLTGFPYSNLAVMTPSGVISDHIYIYHQVNESAFREAVWSGDVGSWRYNLIGVETST